MGKRECSMKPGISQQRNHTLQSALAPSWASLPGLSACSSVLSVGFQGRKRELRDCTANSQLSGIAQREGEEKWLVKEESCVGTGSLFSHLFLQNKDAQSRQEPMCHLPIPLAFFGGLSWWRPFPCTKLPFSSVTIPGSLGP